MTANKKTNNSKPIVKNLNTKSMSQRRKPRLARDEEKFLISTIKQYNRKARTHIRLCNRGAMLEQYLQKPDYLSDEQVAEFFENRISQSRRSGDFEKLLNGAHPENPCL